MTPDEQEMEEEHFLLWEDELPPRTAEEAEELAGMYADAVFPFMLEVELKPVPREPGFFRQLVAWLMLILVVSLPWAAGALLVATIIKAFQ
jgi:hypothetical protein